MRVGIIGLGVIGSAQAEMFAAHDLVTYDPARDDTYPAGMAECDFAIICVGTPERPDGRADLAYVEQAASELPPGVPAVIRSTVPPGTTDRLFKRSGRLYAHAPEFMGENVLHSWQSPVDVPYMIIGGAPEATVFFREKFTRVFPGRITTTTAKESELAKYAANLYWAARVTFVNEFALICESFGVDYERVRDAWLSDPRMGEEYTQRAGYPPGFDGRCWPKDLAALIAASTDAGYDPGFLRSISAANDRFRSTCAECGGWGSGTTFGGCASCGVIGALR
jgi:UDPglucose 6-dehydrogenase